MMWRLDLELGFTNNLGPKQKTNMKIYHMDIVLRVLSITVNNRKSALLDLPVLLLSLIARTLVASEQLRQRFLPLPIRKQYGIKVIIFYKTRICINLICSTTFKFITTANTVALISQISKEVAVLSCNRPC